MFGHFTHGEGLEPAVDILRSLLLLVASVVDIGALFVDAGRGAVLVEVAVLVHGLLERVTLPAEDVVAVGGRTSGVHGVNEGVAAGPCALVKEGGYVPHDLVHDLGKLDGVRGRAATTASGAGTGGVVDVALVVGAVEVLAVPASVRYVSSRFPIIPDQQGGHLRWEDDGLADHLACSIGWDVDCVAASAGGAARELVVVC